MALKDHHPQQDKGDKKDRYNCCEGGGDGGRQRRGKEEREFRHV